MFRNKEKPEVLIVDNFLSSSEIKSISNYLKNREWFFVDDNGKSFGRYKNLGFHRKVNDFSDFSDIEILLIERLKSFFILNKNIEKNILIHSVYYNAVRYGDKFKYHIDGTGPTFLIYCNENWKWWWGAETKIKNYGKIKPSPGRLIVFPGNVYHKACPMNSLSKEQARFSIVFQSNVF